MTQPTPTNIKWKREAGELAGYTSCGKRLFTAYKGKRRGTYILVRGPIAREVCQSLAGLKTWAERIARTSHFKPY